MPSQAGSSGFQSSEAAFINKGLQLVILDHHFYHWVDRYKPESSLEQLCALIGWNMSFTDKAIAVNDRSYIPGLKKMGLSNAEISRLRDYDYMAQGFRKEFIRFQRRRAPGELRYWAGKRRGSLWVIEQPEVRRPFLLQEIALASPDGKADVLEVWPRKLSYSGKPDAVQYLLSLNYDLYGFSEGYSFYSGGDERGSRFWGFRASPHDKIISAAFVESLTEAVCRIIN